VAKLVQLRRKETQVRYRRSRKHLAAKEAKSAQEDGEMDRAETVTDAVTDAHAVPAVHTTAERNPEFAGGPACLSSHY
jgi:hypothetical protein